MDRAFSLAERLVIYLKEQYENLDGIVALLEQVVNISHEPWNLAMKDFQHELYATLPALRDPV
jgi:hypothetical protein